MIHHREKIKDYDPFINWNIVVSVREKIHKAWKFISYLFLVGALTITAFAAGTTNISNWDISLTVTGTDQATVGRPLTDINIRVSNRGLDTPESRLHLIIHAKGHQELKACDIKIEVRKGNVWKAVQFEAIDNGGLMGTIGEQGKPYIEGHKHGGLAMDKKENKLWPLRVTFLIPGRYTLVVAASPDNGQTHLAQPASLSIEALCTHYSLKH